MFWHAGGTSRIPTFLAWTSRDAQGAISGMLEQGSLLPRSARTFVRPVGGPYLAFPAAGSDRVPAGARARWGLLPPPRGGYPQFRRTVGSERESGFLIMSGHEEAWPRGAPRLVPRSSVTRARLSNPSWASLRFARYTDGPTSSTAAQDVFYDRIVTGGGRSASRAHARVFLGDVGGWWAPHVASVRAHVERRLSGAINAPDASHPSPAACIKEPLGLASRSSCFCLPSHFAFPRSSPSFP